MSKLYRFKNCPKCGEKSYPHKNLWFGDKKGMYRGLAGHLGDVIECIHCGTKFEIRTDLYEVEERG